MHQFSMMIVRNAVAFLNKAHTIILTFALSCFAVESTTPRPRTAIIVAVIVIVVILFLICVILMIILILCLCCKKKRSFYILKQHQQHFHDQEDDESQMHQTRYTPVVGDQAADDQGDHQEQNGLSAAISTDNLMQ